MPNEPDDEDSPVRPTFEPHPLFPLQPGQQEYRDIRRILLRPQGALGQTSPGREDVVGGGDAGVVAGRQVLGRRRL